MRLVSQHINEGRIAKVYYEHETREYVVKFYADGAWLKEANYFTGDKLDAQQTAEHFVGKRVPKPFGPENSQIFNNYKEWLHAINMKYAEKEMVAVSTGENAQVNGLCVAFYSYNLMKGWLA